MEEFRQCSGSGLVHDLSSMGLHRPLGNPHLFGDFIVVESTDQRLQHLMLAWRQCVESLERGMTVGLLMRSPAGCTKRTVDEIQKLLFPDGFQEIPLGPALNGGYGEWDKP